MYTSDYTETRRLLGTIDEIQANAVESVGGKAKSAKWQIQHTVLPASKSRRGFANSQARVSNVLDALNEAHRQLDDIGRVLMDLESFRQGAVNQVISIKESARKWVD